MTVIDEHGNIFDDYGNMIDKDGKIIKTKKQIEQENMVSHQNRVPNNVGPNEINKILLHGLPIEEKLHVIVVISNPCLFKKRYKLIGEFVQRIENNETDVILYIVELAYGDQQFMVTDAENKNHLQLRCDVPLWHKENMINLGIKKLLPVDWKAVAWIDSDVEFENVRWAKDTLKLLNGHYDIVQPFSHVLDLDANNINMSIFPSFGYQSVKGYHHTGARNINYWHCGMAWACTRELYQRMDGLFQLGILGSGDYNMAMCIIGKGEKSFIAKSNDSFRREVLLLQDRIKGAKLGAVNGVIRHYFHGSKVNRKYTERWQILAKYDYNPDIHVMVDGDGILVPTEDCPKEFLNDIYKYFLERNEDE